MASRNGDTSQYLSLVGVNLPHVGYGKMVAGLRDALSTKVELCDDAERVVFALRPNLIKGWRKTRNDRTTDASSDGSHGSRDSALSARLSWTSEHV